MNCKTVNGRAPVELLIANDSKDKAVRREGPAHDIRPFLELLPKDRVEPTEFVNTGELVLSFFLLRREITIILVEQMSSFLSYAKVLTFVKNFVVVGPTSRYCSVVHVLSAAFVEAEARQYT